MKRAGLAVIRSCFSISVIKIKLLSSQKGSLQSAQTLQDSQVIREDTKAPFAFITEKAPGKCSDDKKTSQGAFKPGGVGSSILCPAHCPDYHTRSLLGSVLKLKCFSVAHSHVMLFISSKGTAKQLLYQGSKQRKVHEDT